MRSIQWLPFLLLWLVSSQANHYIRFIGTSVITYGEKDLLISCMPDFNVNIEIYYTTLSKKTNIEKYAEIVSLHANRNTVDWSDNDIKNRSYIGETDLNNAHIKLKILKENVKYYDAGIYQCKLVGLLNGSYTTDLDYGTIQTVTYDYTNTTDVTTLETETINATSVPVTTTAEVTTSTSQTIESTSEPTTSKTAETTFTVDATAITSVSTTMTISVPNTTSKSTSDAKTVNSRTRSTDNTTTLSVTNTTSIGTTDAKTNITSLGTTDTTTNTTSIGTTDATTNTTSIGTTDTTTNTTSIGTTDTTTNTTSIGTTDAKTNTTSIGTTDTTTNTTSIGTTDTTTTTPVDIVFTAQTARIPINESVTTDNLNLKAGLGIGIPLFFVMLIMIIVIRIYNQKKYETDDDLDRTMPVDHGFFTGAIPGRFNSWNRQAAYPFNGQWDDESVESDRVAYDNEMFSGKDNYVYDNNKGGRLDHYSWDFIFQSLPRSTQYLIMRPETEPTPNQVNMKKGGPTTIV